MVYVVGADFGERSCPRGHELRCENPQLAYHQTPPCNMYFVINWLLFFVIFISILLQNFQSMGCEAWALIIPIYFFKIGDYGLKILVTISI
jgi:cytochrome c oxidase subunit IV